MKNKSTQSLVLTLIGLIIAIFGAYTFARSFLNPSLSEHSPIFSTYYGKATPIPFPAFEPKIAATLPGRIHSFAVSPDIKTIAFATSKGIVLYNLESYKQLRTLNDTENGFSVAWSPDGKKLAMGSLIMRNSEAGKPHLVAWDTSTWKILFEPKIGNSETMFFGALAWSPTGKFLATSDYDRGLVAFDVKTGMIVSLQKDFLIPHMIFPGHRMARVLLQPVTLALAFVAGGLTRRSRYVCTIDVWMQQSSWHGHQTENESLLRIPMARYVSGLPRPINAMG